MAASARLDRPVKLGFLLFPGFPMACLTSAIEPLRAANEIIGRQAFAWTLLGETDAPVRSSAEVGFTPDTLLGQLPLEPSGGLDHLYLLSPPTAEFVDVRHTPAILRRLDRAGITIGAFSGGIFPLVRAGLMAGHRCSVHWCYDTAFKSEFPDIQAEETVIVRDRRRITASGAGAVFDLMLRLIEEHLGAETVTEVACWFQHPFVRDENTRQKVPVQHTSGTADALPDAIRRAIGLFDNHVEEPLRIPDVAAAVDMSPRNFERLFKRETGQSPLRYYHLVRLKKARQRVLYSNETLSEIAASVGYDRPGSMSRLYAKVFGISPQDERRGKPGLRGLTPGWVEAH